MLDILKCNKHLSTYECKKEGRYPDVAYFCDWSGSNIQKPAEFGYNQLEYGRYKNIYLLDNVIGTGRTMLMARDIGLGLCQGEKHSAWIYNNRHIARPLVYAVDSTKISLSVAKRLFLV